MTKSIKINNNFFIEKCSKLNVNLNISVTIIKNPISYLIILLSVYLINEYCSLSMNLSKHKLLISLFSYYNNIPYIIYNFMYY